MRSRLASMFYENAQNAPEKLAIWCDGKMATYSEMADLVSRYSNLLLSLGAHIWRPYCHSHE